MPNKYEGGKAFSNVHSSLPVLPKVATSVRESVSVPVQDSPMKSFVAHDMREETPNMVNYGPMPGETDSLDQIEVSVRVTRKPQEKRGRFQRLQPLDGAAVVTKSTRVLQTPMARDASQDSHDDRRHDKTLEYAQLPPLMNNPFKNVVRVKQ